MAKSHRYSKDKKRHWHCFVFATGLWWIRSKGKLFDEIELKDLKKENGLGILIDFFDKTLGKDDLSDSLEKFEDFEDYRRGPNETILDYISRFDQKYNRLKKLGMELPSAIVAFILLRRANITRDERLLVLTGMDYTERDKLYEQAKTSLKNSRESRQMWLEVVQGQVAVLAKN